MKYILSLVFVLNVFGITIMAQTTPPPPPLIYRNPDKSDLKEFISEDKTFQIVFPGVPKVMKTEKTKGFVVEYRVYRQGANSVVDVAEFGFDMENRKDQFYEILRESFLEAPKSKIESEKDITIDGIAGKEFAVLQDYNYRRVRVVIKGKRVYEIISDVTNWHILTAHYKEKVDDFNKETDRLFVSFKFLESK